MGVKTHVCNFLSNGSRKKNVCVFLDKDDYASAIKKKKKRTWEIWVKSNKREILVPLWQLFTPKYKLKGKKAITIL